MAKYKDSPAFCYT